MAYVVCVCGAGGKTTYCYTLAKKKALLNKKVCILTTTHMWNDGNVSDLCKLNHIECGLVYFFGNIHDEKVTFVSENDYIKICEKFDYVIIEADGSKCMPMKIPNIDTEPVIPYNVNEIVIIFGKQAIDRKIGVICHRFNDFYAKDKYLQNQFINYDTYVTEDIYKLIRDHYYVEPLKLKFPNAIFTLYDADMTKSQNYKSIKNLDLVICASGFSKRFGKEDKLNTLINGKKMYELMIDKMINVKNILIRKFDEEVNHKININVAITVRDNLYNVTYEYSKENNLIILLNKKASEGLSSSIRLATNKFIDDDAIMFINCDVPYLSEKELVYYLFYSICSNNNISAMYNDIPKNPAYFEKMYFPSLLETSGDKGPRELLDKNMQKLYVYHIDKKEIIDIDVREDII